MRIGDKPLVSIGMPIYNGAHSLRRSLESLLAQDYENFELIISDNHSTDSTLEICLDYMAKDKRIRYLRNEMNVGAIRNFNKVFEISEGEFFMWHAHDDYREPSYISACLEVLENNPNVILSCTKVLVKENEGLRELNESFSTIGMAPHKRFHKILWSNSGASIYGLFRRISLRKTRLFRNAVGADILLLSELSLMGEFHEVPLFLFTKSIRGGSVAKKIKVILESILPDGHRVFLPFTKMGLEYWKLVRDSDLGGTEKKVAFLDIILCFLVKYKIFLSDPGLTFYLNLLKLKE